jgi:hydroxymethylglutaryl-CoA lyase
LQIEEAFVPTARKIEMINLLSASGIRDIQATSFVRHDAVPQLRDAEAVMASIDRREGVTYSALVLNEKGAERAIEADLNRLDVVVSVSRSHSLRNAGMEPTDAMQRAGRVAKLARDAGTPASLGLATALGCPFEGFPEYKTVEDAVAVGLERHGYESFTIADTAGMAGPTQVFSVLSNLIAKFPSAEFAVHLHDTRRLGLANLLAGLGAGVRRVDSSVAGLGGCPFVPGATGNVATEDVLNLLDLLGLSGPTTVDAFLPIARQVAKIIGHADSAVLRAGSSRHLQKGGDA